MQVAAKSRVRKRSVSIATDELVELELVSARICGDFWDAGKASLALLAASREKNITFGQGLSRSELEWIKAAIEKVVVQGK